jgi:hypothetical protein
MKTVTTADFYNFRAALDSYQRVHADHIKRRQKANAYMLAMSEAGQEEEGAALGIAAQAAATLAHANAGAAFEAATLVFLGEQRGRDESPDAYLLRILDVIQTGDIGEVFAMQARNGLRADINTPT